MDSWAVDYGLLRDGRLLGNPFHYRDARTERSVAAVHERMPHAELFERNGLQFLPFNTLYQYAAEPRSILDFADTALLIPDLIAFWLTGQARAEQTNASTTGLVRVLDGTWDEELIRALGIPRGILPSLIAPGERVGTLLPEVAAAIGARAATPVTAVGSHDTASAVVAVPMRADAAAYISCGTWGLVGVEVDHLVLTPEALAANFTNEGGVDGRVRLLHNVMGLWVLSEAVRTWEREGHPIDLPTLLDSAEEVNTAVPVFDINDPRFLAPGDMPRADRRVVRRARHRRPADARGVRPQHHRVARPGVRRARRRGWAHRPGRRADDPHRRRRRPQRAPLPAHRRPVGTPRARRPRRGDGPRQPARAGACRRARDRVARGAPRPRRPHPRTAPVHTARSMMTPIDHFAR